MIKGGGTCTLHTPAMFKLHTYSFDNGTWKYTVKKPAEVPDEYPDPSGNWSRSIWIYVHL